MRDAVDAFQIDGITPEEYREVGPLARRQIAARAISAVLAPRQKSLLEARSRSRRMRLMRGSLDLVLMSAWPPGSAPVISRSLLSRRGARRRDRLVCPRPPAGAVDSN